VTALDGGSVERSCRSRGLLLAAVSSQTVPVLRALPLELTLSDRVRNRDEFALPGFDPSSGLVTLAGELQ